MEDSSTASSKEIHSKIQTYVVSLGALFCSHSNAKFSTNFAREKWKQHTGM